MIPALLLLLGFVFFPLWAALASIALCAVFEWLDLQGNAFLSGIRESRKDGAEAEDGWR